MNHTRWFEMRRQMYCHVIYAKKNSHKLDMDHRSLNSTMEIIAMYFMTCF